MTSLIYFSKQRKHLQGCRLFALTLIDWFFLRNCVCFSRNIRARLHRECQPQSGSGERTQTLVSDIVCLIVNVVALPNSLLVLFATVHLDVTAS